MKNYLIIIKVALLFLTAVGCSTIAKQKESPTEHEVENIKKDKVEKELTAAEKITQQILAKIDSQDHKIAVIEFSELKGSK